MTARFSVAVPVYNCADFIAGTLDAILGQELPPDEVVVVDDGSTDATPEVLARYAGRITVLRVDNGGPGAARKHAVESCRNRWIAMCDSDDIWDAGHLGRFALMIDTFPDANILCTNFHSFGPTADLDQSHFESAGPTWLVRHGRELSADHVELTEPYAAFLEFNPFYPSGVAVSREVYDLSGGIRREYSRWPAEDSEFSRRLIAAPTARVVLDRVVSWRYRRHGSNFSETQWKNVHAKARILREHLDKQVVPAKLVSDTQRWVLKTRGQAFDIAFWTGHYGAALDLYRELPVRERSLKRQVRRALAWLRARSAGS